MVTAAIVDWAGKVDLSINWTGKHFCYGQMSSIATCFGQKHIDGEHILKEHITKVEN